MEVDFRPGEERLERLHQPVAVVPPALAGQLRLQVAPQALDQAELRGVRRQEEGLEAAREAQPDCTQVVTCGS